MDFCPLNPVNAYDSGGNLYHWTANSGLSFITDIDSFVSYGAGISDDGQVVAGTLSTGNAFIWTPTNGLTDIGRPTGVTHDMRSVRLDGAGTRVMAMGGGEWVWSASAGWQSLEALLVAQGANGLVGNALQLPAASSFDSLANSGRAVLCEVTQFNPYAAFYAVAYFDGPAPGTIGANYCGPMPVNSTGLPSNIYATGSAVISNNDLVLNAANLPENQIGYVLNSQGQAYVLNPAGSKGHLCVGGSQPLGRHNSASEVRFSGSAGAFSIQLDSTALPTPNGSTAASAGETWNFQVWHRDFENGVSTSNFTDAVSITFE